MRAVLLAGAEKISVNSAAVKNPEIISQGAGAFGNQCVVLGMDVLKVPVSEAIPSGYEVVIHGGRKPTGMDALAWAQKGQAFGAGEICLNSIDADGTKEGYELNLTRLISQAVEIPVIASGGAGRPEHLADVLTKGSADAALIASMTHYGEYTIKEIKDHLHEAGIFVRRFW
jgi:cyclase